MKKFREENLVLALKFHFITLAEFFARWEQLQNEVGEEDIVKMGASSLLMDKGCPVKKRSDEAA